MTSDEAVRIAKRLAPDEIFLQEVRGAEAYPLLQALESGHPGCTSWHARPGKELESLAMMVRQRCACSRNSRTSSAWGESGSIARASSVAITDIVASGVPSSCAAADSAQVASERRPP